MLVSTTGIVIHSRVESKNDNIAFLGNKRLLARSSYKREREVDRAGGLCDTGGSSGQKPYICFCTQNRTPFLVSTPHSTGTPKKKKRNLNGFLKRKSFEYFLVLTLAESPTI